ncbi:mitochondrial escape protein 2 [Tilletia horrida]|nr:mitochondrial escape protein 2 [Tilletia horrida]
MASRLLTIHTAASTTTTITRLTWSPSPAGARAAAAVARTALLFPLHHHHHPRLFSSSPIAQEESAAAPLPKSDKPDEAPAYSPDHPPQPPPADPRIKTAYLYFSIYPIRLGWWDIRAWLGTLDTVSTLDRIKRTIPPQHAIGHDFKLVDVQERRKDGGAFGVFQYTLNQQSIDGKPEERDTALLDIESHLQKNIKGAQNSWVAAFIRPAVHVVRGKPWLEDLARFPGHLVKIVLEGGSGEVGEEELWETLRPYGHIKWLEKTKPNEYTASFTTLRGATIARNCIYGFRMPNNARVKLTYERVFRGRMAWDWLQNHPRIVIPILAVLAGTLANLFFDPIRAWFVQSKVTNLFDLEQYSVLKYIKNKTEAFFRPDDDGSVKEDDWWERKQAAAKIAGWLKESPSTFITLTGPRGSGKHQLLARAIPPEVKHLTLDCDVIARSSKSEVSLLTAVASEVGYWPVFGWLNSLGNLVDLASVGLIGSKAGFATPTDQQLRSILSVATSALVTVKEKNIKAAEKRRKLAQRNAHPQAGSSASASSSSSSSSGGHASILSEKARLEAAEEAKKAQEQKEKEAAAAGGYVSSLTAAGSAALSGVTAELGKNVGSLKSSLIGGSEKAEKSDEAKEQELERAQDGSRQDELGPEKGLVSEGGTQNLETSYDIPVVVVKHFCHKGVKQPLLWTALSEWAAELVTNQIAHVVFVSDHQVAANKELSKALPNIPFDQIVLADADEERARSYVYQKLVAMGRLQAPPSATPPTATDNDASVASSQPSPAAGSLSSVSAASNAPAAVLVRQARAAAASSPATAAPAPAAGLDAETAKWVDKLGGRLTDLETLVQKVSLGQSVDGAVQDIIARTVVELRKNAFGDDAEDAKNLSWTRDQAWAVVSALAAKGELSYYGTLHDTFKGDENALKAMESADVIAVRHLDGRPHTIHAGRPVFQSAIQRLLADDVFSDTRKYEANANAISSNEKIVHSVEAELKELVDVLAVKGGAEAVRARSDFLFRKLSAAQKKVAECDAANTEIKERLLRTRSLDAAAAAA